MRPDLSIEVIIPSYNRMQVLKDTLQRIRQLYPHVKICVGLQGQVPDSGFQSLLERDPELRIEKQSEPATVRSLNHCIETSSADIILLLDDDAIPCPGWLEEHLRAFTDDPALVYTSGRVIELRRNRPAFSEWTRIMTEWFFGIFMGRDKKINGRIVGWINGIGLLFGNFDQPGTCRINAPREGNMGIRREAFIQYGGFNNSFVGNAWGYGSDLGLRMAKKDVYGQYLGSAVVLHLEIPTGGSRGSDKQQWLKDFFHNHKVMLRNIGPQGWIGSIPRLVKKVFLD